MRRRTGGGLVYSTEAGRMCPSCRQPIGQCVCQARKSMPATDGVVRVSHETKGRGGKAVTVIDGLSLDRLALTRLGKQLKAACGTGGTVKDSVIELQGDQRDAAAAFLEKQGWSVKRAGG